MTPEELKEIDERADKATPGPWTTETPKKDEDGWTQGVSVASTGRGSIIYSLTEGGAFPYNDRYFIAHARTDIPALLAHIREQEVYVMAWKLYEKFPSFNITPILVFQSAFLKHFHDGKYWWMVDGREDSDQEFDSWQSAVRDAYKTLIDEGKG